MVVIFHFFYLVCKLFFFLVILLNAFYFGSGIPSEGSFDCRTNTNICNTDYAVDVFHMIFYFIFNFLLLPLFLIFWIIIKLHFLIYRNSNHSGNITHINVSFLHITNQLKTECPNYSKIVTTTF